MNPRDALWRVVLAGYLLGGAILFVAVPLTCTDPRCTHGWYAQSNGLAKGLFVIWMVCIPLLWLGAIDLYYTLSGRPTPEQQRIDRARKQQRDEEARAREVSAARRIQEMASVDATAVVWSGSKCDYCGRSLERGTPYWFKSHFEGQINSKVKVCEACREAALQDRARSS